jgi:acetylornithine/succinyldiaminopimelate/putrescine aminotransferase/predicted amino acid dehydrogenase
MNDFTHYINPWLGDLLHKLGLDLDFQRGQGCWLYSGDEKYLDCVSAYGALPFGHNPPAIWSALEQVKSRSVPGFAQPSALAPAAALAKRLIELAPEGLEQVTFTNSGAEAVEAAIKACRAATGRLTILSTKQSFHGKTLAALSATGNPSYQRGFGAPAPGFEHIPYGDSTALEQYLREHSADTAAFIVEPIQGEGGVITPPPGYLTQVRAICSGYDVPLVLDEIQTGLGRTGHLFACMDEEVKPDVMLLAKALGGGLVPVGAVLTSAPLFCREFGHKHSSTFAAGALASFAGLAVLAELTAEDGKILKHVREIGSYLHSQLKTLCAQYDFVSVRGRGLMLGLDFQINRTTHPGNLLGLLAEQKLLTPLIASYLLHAHKLRVAPTLNGASVIRIQAPLIIAKNEADFLIQAVANTLPVLDAGDTTTLLAHLLETKPKKGKLRKRQPLTKTQPQPEQTRFAFLIHPLDDNSFAEFDRNLSHLSQENLSGLVQKWLPEMEPFVVGESVISSKTGARAFCEFITIPRTAQQLLEMDPQLSLKIVRQGVEIAKTRGAQLVGLGAFTSVVSWGGLGLRDAGVPLTTGNSYTVVTAIEATVSALNRLQINPGQATAAVVGAAGSIGRCLALLLAQSVARLILLGNPANPQRSEKKLATVAGEICQHLLNSAPQSPLGRIIAKQPDCPSKNADLETFTAFYQANAGHLPLTISVAADNYLPAADVVVTATNSVSALVKPEKVKFGAVICDLSQPANVSREIKSRRPDVLVIDGGVVEIWNRPDLGWDFGFEKGLCYACMAETMLLALEGHLEHTSIGSNISLETLTLVKELADKHGFRVADLRSFNKPLKEKDWQRVITARDTGDVPFLSQSPFRK